MSSNTGIEYVDHSLGFWIGCQAVPDSPACDNCYARREMKRYGLDPYKVVRTSRATWRQPLARSRATKEYRWKSGDIVFVCTWSDFFHPDADGWRTEAWDLMRKRPDLKWVIVTKRIENAATWIPLNWEWHNRTILVTVENQAKADERIPKLLELGNQFDNLTLGLSIEPMLGEIDLSEMLPGHYWYDWEKGCLINWVVVGGESGSNRRECKIEWIRSIAEQCKAANVPVFVKQIHFNGKLVKDIKLFPKDLQIRQYPKRLKINQ